MAVPVDTHGQWLPERIDLDSNGEIVRIGAARPLLEGSFRSKRLRNRPKIASRKIKGKKQRKTCVIFCVLLLIENTFFIFS